MQINDKKKFNGKIYRLIKSSNKKSIINEEKYNHKQSGWLVRVTKEEGMWRLWRRTEKTLHPGKYLVTGSGTFHYDWKNSNKNAVDKRADELYKKRYAIRRDTWTNDDTGKKYYTIYKRKRLRHHKQ